MSRRLIDLFLGGRRSPSPLVSRRKMLQAGLAFTAGSFLSSSAKRTFGANRRGAKVLVVGGGFAGLACAYELVSCGYDVTVFEARKRIGGRVHSIGDLIAGKNVEGGAELVGSNHPLMMAYATKFGLELLNSADDSSDLPSMIHLGGRMLSTTEVQGITAEIDAALARMTDDARAVVSDQPWNTPDANRLDTMATSEWVDRQQLSPLAKSLITVQLSSTNGVALQNQSYLGNLSQICGGGLEKYWTDSEVHRIKGGNQQIAQRFGKELGDERVLSNRPVKEIVTTQTVATLVDAEGNKHVADEIVLAVPPSVWSTIKFTPELPQMLKPQMGMNVKFLAVVRDRFWKEAKLPPRATMDQIVNQIWEGTAGQAIDGQAALVAFSGAAAADPNHRRAVAERQPEYLKTFESLYPGFADHFVKGRFMDWVADPWTKAGYSFPAPGQVTTQGPILQKGLGRLHFAGEHTCYAFVGYMEGALQSGAGLARRIAIRDGIIQG